MTVPVTTYYRKLDVDSVCPDDVHHSPRSFSEEGDSPVRSDSEAMDEFPAADELFDTGQGTEEQPSVNENHHRAGDSDDDSPDDNEKLSDEQNE